MLTGEPQVRHATCPAHWTLTVKLLNKFSQNWRGKGKSGPINFVDHHDEDKWISWHVNYFVIAACHSRRHFRSNFVNKKVNSFRKLKITRLILIELDLIEYHSIALWMLYRKSFEAKLIGVSVRSQIHAERPRRQKNRYSRGCFRDFTATRLVQGQHTHNQSCRTHQGLSIGIK